MNKFDPKNEKTGLTEEKNTRLGVMQTHNSSIIAAGFVTWGALAAIFAFVFTNIDTLMNVINNQPIVAVFIFLFLGILACSPSFLLIPFAVKERENIVQILSLGKYDQYMIDHNNKYSWEALHPCSFKGYEKYINQEYTLFSVFASIVLFVYGCFSVALLLGSTHCYKLIAVVSYVIVLALVLATTIAATIKIYKISNLKGIVKFVNDEFENVYKTALESMIKEESCGDNDESDDN